MSDLNLYMPSPNHDDNLIPVEDYSGNQDGTVFGLFVPVPVVAVINLDSDDEQFQNFILSPDYGSGRYAVVKLEDV